MCDPCVRADGEKDSPQACYKQLVRMTGTHWSCCTTDIEVPDKTHLGCCLLWELACNERANWAQQHRRPRGILLAVGV